MDETKPWGTRSEAIWMGYAALFQLIFLCCVATAITTIFHEMLIATAGGSFLGAVGFSIIIATVVFVGLIFSFGLSHLLQSLLIHRIGPAWNAKSVIAHLGAIMICSALTALSYDYLTPTYRYYTDPGPDWAHGLTFYRWRFTLPLQFVLASYTCWKMQRLFSKQVSD